ncbi:MAG: hypothetical protein ACE5J0_02440, partial [Candidatus Paceibacterales bacterium]
RAVSLLAIKKVLGFSDEKIEEMGAEVPKYSSVIRFAMKFLGLVRNVETYYQNIPRMWKRFVTVGEFWAESNEEKKRVIIRIKALNIHPILCTYLLGILPAFHEIARGRKATCQETKCPFRGDNYHEFINRW